MIIKIQDPVLSMVAMSSPTVFVPGYSFPLEIRLLLGYPSLSTVLLKRGSVQLLEHSTAQSANNNSTSLA